MDLGTLPQNLHQTGYGTVGFGDDSALAVEFFWDIRKSHMTPDGLFRIKRGDKGEIGERILMLKIHLGMRDTAIREATEEDKQRFHRQYQAFLANEDQMTVEGTPLDMIPFIDKGWLEHLRYNHLYTAEQVCASGDVQMKNFPAGAFQQLQQKLRAHLEMVKGNAPIAALETKTKLLEDDNKDKDRQIIEMKAQLETLTELVHKSQPKRGRPKKETADGSIT